MPNLRDIRKRIEATISISKITTTMEKIATVRMTRMMGRMETAKAYNSSLMEMSQDLYLSALKEDHQQQFCALTRRKKIRAAGLIFIGSEQGLCAGFNVALNQVLAEHQQKLKKANLPIKYYPIGKKAVVHLQRQKIPIECFLSRLNDRFTYDNIEEFCQQIVRDIDRGVIDDLSIIYTHYVASATYKVVTESLSPCKMLAKKINGKKSIKVQPMICHPTIEELISDFLPEIIHNRIYQAILESMVCEQMTRRMAMQQATDAAGDKVDELRTLYHTLRQAKITREVNEMMGTVIALQKE